MRRLFLYNEWRGLNCYIFIIRYQIKIGKEKKSVIISIRRLTGGANKNG